MSHENDLGEVIFTHYPSIFVFNKGEDKKHIEIHAEDNAFDIQASIEELMRNKDWEETPEEYKNDDDHEEDDDEDL